MYGKSLMAALFQTKITHHRFTLSPFSSEQMASMGERMITRITDRITSAVNVRDNSAKPLTDKYAKRKGKYGRGLGRVPIRNWTFRDVTLKALKVKSASENHVTIGFVNPKANQIVTALQRIEPMWGVSPKDREYSYTVMGDLILQGAGQVRSEMVA